MTMMTTKTTMTLHYASISVVVFVVDYIARDSGDAACAKRVAAQTPRTPICAGASASHPYI